MDVVEDQVPGWIRKIQQKEGQRQLLVDTQSASTGEILRDLKEGRCDLGIVSEKEEEGELHFQLLEEMEYMAAVYERHPLASKESMMLKLPQITAKRRFYLAVAKGSRFRETHSESILRALTDSEG